MDSTAQTQVERPAAMFRERVAGPPNTDFLVRIPVKRSRPSPILVSVHGLARHPLQNFSYLVDVADRLGAILVAPYFSKEHHHGFQWLETWKGGGRADLVLNALIAQLAKAYDADPSRVVLFGFSGGGQFCHRYAMFHPARVSAVISVAAGWYTFPDDAPFPLGTAPDRSRQLTPDLNGFLRVPTLVLVGSRDTERNDALNQKPEIDERQGPNRLVRAQRWVAALNAAASSRGLSLPARVQVLKGVGHSLKECITKSKLTELIVEFAAQGLDKPPERAARQVQ